MKEDANQIGSKVKHPAMRDTAGIGYIIIPNNIDYYEYVLSCYRNSCVTILTDDNELIKNVLVSKSAWNEIDFPKKTSDKGSAVVWLNLSSKNKPVIVAVMNRKTDYQANREMNAFNFTKDDEFTSVSIDGDGKTGIITVSVDGETSKESKILYRVNNKNNAGQFSLYVQGDIYLESENDVDLKIRNKLNLQFIDEKDVKRQTNISYELRVGFTYNDEFGNKIVINEKGVEINDKNGNNIKTHENGIEASIEDNKIALKKNVVGLAFKGKFIKIDDTGVTVEALDQDVIINAGDNVIQMTESGINIDSGTKKISLNGAYNVLYSKSPRATEITDVAEIGVSKTVTVGG